MPDPMAPARPRVALVTGDADSAGPLRAAMADHVDVVYATTASEFDDARLRESGATAAIVNLDGGDWLDAVERRLSDACVPVVFNDPDISGRLAGWEQARWLRHLTAKLRGSTDYDPPRPRDARQAAPGDDVLVAGDVPADADPAGAPSSHGCSSPGATAEAASMPPGHGASAPAEAAVPATVTASIDTRTDAPFPAAPQQEPDMQPPAVVGGTQAHAALTPSSPEGTQPEDTTSLDLDTAALSAMIDARLAEPERGTSPESTEVWRVAGDEDSAAGDPPAGGSPAGGSPAAGAGAAAPIGAPVDEKDVLKGLPSVDDWQLVDPEAPIAPAGPVQPSTQPEAAPGSGGLAGLELVPMEAPVAVAIRTEAIERWMRVDSRAREQRGERRQPAPGPDGDAA